MDKIEKVKERLAFFPRELRDGGFSDNSLAFGARLDIEYLLSKLDMAEKALEKVSKNGKLEVTGSDAENILIMCGDIADETLEEMRS